MCEYLYLNTILLSIKEHYLFLLTVWSVVNVSLFYFKKQKIFNISTGFLLLAFVLASIFTKYTLSFIPAIFATCYIFLYTNLSSQHNVVEKNSNSNQTQSIIDDLKKQIEKRKNKIDNLLAERDKKQEENNKKQKTDYEKNSDIQEEYEEKIENILKRKIYSNFDLFQTFKQIKKYKMYDVFSVIKANINQNDADFELYDTNPQVKNFFHFLYNMSINDAQWFEKYEAERHQKLYITRNINFYLIDIKEATFSISGFDFTGCNFTRCNLSGMLKQEDVPTIFNKTSFNGCNFSDAVFGRESEFHVAELSYTKFQNAKFCWCKFGYEDYNPRVDASLKIIQFLHGYFNQYQYSPNLMFNSAELHKYTTYSTNLAYCDFSNATFDTCDFKHCDLECASFNNATFDYHGSSFSACNLAGVDFSNCNFKESCGLDEKEITIFDSQTHQIEGFYSVGQSSFFLILECIKHYKKQGFKLDKIEFRFHKNNKEFIYFIHDNLKPLEIPDGEEKYYDIKDIDKEVLEKTFENLRNKLKEAENKENNNVCEWSENGITLKYGGSKGRYCFYVNTNYYSNTAWGYTRITFDEFDKRKQEIYDFMWSEDNKDPNYHFDVLLPNYYTTKTYKKYNTQKSQYETIPPTKFPNGFDPTQCKGLVEVYWKDETNNGKFDFGSQSRVGWKWLPVKK